MSSVLYGHVGLPLVFFLTPVISVFQVTAENAVLDSPELHLLVVRALEHNPSVCAARKHLDRSVALHQSKEGFFDPSLSASTGRNRRSPSVPWYQRTTGITDDSVSGKAGLDLPVRPGAYFAAGLTEQYMMEPGDDYDSLYQSSVGAQLWIPLLKDRRFAEWKAEESVAAGNMEVARHGLEQVCQNIRHQVELGYIGLLRAAAAVDEARMSLDRARRLLEEAEDLSGLNAIPEYQVYSARMEVALREEEFMAAEEAVKLSLLDLSFVVGTEVDELNLLSMGETLLAWAGVCPEPPPVALEHACTGRGSYKAALSRVKSLESDLELARERMKTDLGLSVSAAWTGEDADNLVGTDLLISEEHVGTEIALVWRRPLGFRSERADAAAAAAMLGVASEEVRRTRLEIDNELKSTEVRLRAARERLELCAVAVEEAGRALDAEEDRFRLGEGRSRNVLDAQKDLTAATRRRNDAAAEVLRSWSGFLHAAGYSCF